MPQITAHEIKRIVQRFWCDCGGEFVWTHHNRQEDKGTCGLGPYKHIHRCTKCKKEALVEDHCYPEHLLVQEGDEDNPTVLPWQGPSMPQILLDQRLAALTGADGG